MMIAWSLRNIRRSPPMSMSVQTTVAPASRPRPVAMSIPKPHPPHGKPDRPSSRIPLPRLKDGYW